MGHLRICGPSLTETSLWGAYLYCALHSSVFTECVWCACTNVREIKRHRVRCPSLSVQKLTVYQQSCTDGLHRLCDRLNDVNIGRLEMWGSTVLRRNFCYRKKFLWDIRQ